MALKELILVVAMLIRRYEFQIPKQYQQSSDYVIPDFQALDTPMLGVRVTLRNSFPDSQPPVGKDV